MLVEFTLVAARAADPDDAAAALLLQADGRTALEQWPPALAAKLCARGLHTVAPLMLPC